MTCNRRGALDCTHVGLPTRFVIEPHFQVTEVPALEHLDNFLRDLPHWVRLPVPVTVVPQGLPLVVQETPALTELPVRVPSVDVDVPDRQLASEVAADVPLGLLRPFSRFRQKAGKAVFQMILL